MLSPNEQLPPSESIQAVADNSNSESAKNPDTAYNSIICDLCNVSASSAKNLEDHKKGRKHLRNLSKIKDRKKSSKHSEIGNKMSSNSESNHIQPSNFEGNKSKRVNEKRSKHRVNNQDNHSKKYSSFHRNNYAFNNNEFYSDNFYSPYDNNSRNYSNRNCGWEPWQQNPINQIASNKWNGVHSSHKERNFRYNPTYNNYHENIYPLNNYKTYRGRYETSKNNSPVSYPKNNIIVKVNNPDSISNKCSEKTESMQIENHYQNDKLTAICPDGKSNLTEQLEERFPDKIADDSVNNSNDLSTSVDELPDADKQGEKRNTLSENMTGKKIAHWIKPSNMKDKAEVMRLVNEFSKSKKKENLLRLKLQADNASDENSYGEKELSLTEPFAVFPSCSVNEDTDNSNTVLSVLDSDMITSEISKNSGTGLVSRRKKDTKSNGTDNSNSPVLMNRSLSVNDLIPSANSGRRKSTSESNDRPAKKVRRKPSVSSQGSSSGTSARNEVSAQKKRKNSLQKSNNSKKHMCSSAECMDACINNVVCSAETASESSASLTNSLINPKETLISTAINSNPTENIPQAPVKQEFFEFEGDISQLHPSILEAFNMNETAKTSSLESVYNPDAATMSPVESLINLFASGNVKVKKEFDDPVIDVLRTVDPAVLDKVCEGQATTTVSSTTETPQNAITSETHSSVPQSYMANNCIDVRRESHAINNPIAVPNENPTNNLESLKSSLSHVLHEIQSNSAVEEKVKKNIEKSDHKIQEYQALLDEWKTKKIKFISEEEVLRKRRNDLLKTMTNLLSQHNSEQNSLDIFKARDSTLDLPSVPVINGDVSKGLNETNAIPVQNQPVCDESSNSQIQSKPALTHSVVRREDNEEITIISVPEKDNDIPVIDLAESDNLLIKEEGSSGSSHTGAILEEFSKAKDIVAHEVSINSLQVYEDFLYTCSNDCTAKRFDLSDYTKTVTYLHQKRNVTQLCVEKIRDINLVFTTTSSSKQISSFKAEDGTLHKVFTFTSSVASICKGKGIIYAGLRSGSVVACNWKDHKEIVNIAEPIRSIDTTYQGRLNVLVTLSVNGNVSIRDADRNGLLIRYVKARSYVPLFMTVCSDSIYLSSAGVLTVLDITTGRFVTKYSFSAAYTSLAVYRDTIFTASFSGLVRCYSKNEEKEVKMYYGAGNTAITCINVYNGWVFTGNRAGLVSAFKYEPSVEYHCKIGSCDFLFPRIEDLEFHVLLGRDHDLSTAGSVCSWRKCQTIIPTSWDREEIKAHIKKHIHS